MAYDRNRLSSQDDLQDIQERVAARKAARARARQEADAASQRQPSRTGGSNPRASDARVLGGGQGSARRGTSAPVRTPSQGGMMPRLVSYEEAHGPNIVLIALAALVAIAAIVFLVGHVRGCLAQHRAVNYTPTAQLSAPGALLARETLERNALEEASLQGTFRSESPVRTPALKMPLFEVPRARYDSSQGPNLQGLIFDGLPIGFTQAQTLLTLHPNYTSKVEPVLQYPDYESGCEVASLTAVLRSMGQSPLVEDVIDCLVMDGAFSQGFAGTVYGEGGAFPRGVVKAANAYCQQHDAGLRGHDLTGSTFESLLALVQAGYPVLAWTTMYMDDYYPSDEYEWHHRWYWNEHVVVVYGVMDGEIVVADPLEGRMVRNTQAFKDIYEDCGSMAMMVAPF